MLPSYIDFKAKQLTLNKYYKNFNVIKFFSISCYKMIITIVTTSKDFCDD